MSFTKGKQGAPKESGIRIISDFLTASLEAKRQWEGLKILQQGYF